MEGGCVGDLPGGVLSVCSSTNVCVNAMYSLAGSMGKDTQRHQEEHRHRREVKEAGGSVLKLGAGCGVIDNTFA